MSVLSVLAHLCDDVSTCCSLGGCIGHQIWALRYREAYVQSVLYGSRSFICHQKVGGGWG
jgi:hypothetical protein